MTQRIENSDRGIAGSKNTRPKGKNMNELQEMEAAQDALKTLKGHLRNIQKINEDAGRLPAANAAFGAIAELDVWHSKATESLHQHWPELAGGIQTRGGGGGR